MSYKSRKRTRKIGKLLFVLYLGFVVWFLVFSDWYGRTSTMQEYHYNLVPFQEIMRFWNYRDQLGMLAVMNLVGNVAIFVPLGFLGAMVRKRRSFIRTSLDGFLFSLLVEIFQFVAKVGRFDVDDLILNTIGAMLGYIIFIIVNAMRRVYAKKR